jgi:hypothetical protein
MKVLALIWIAAALSASAQTLRWSHHNPDTFAFRAGDGAGGFVYTSYPTDYSVRITWLNARGATNHVEEIGQGPGGGGLFLVKVSPTVVKARMHSYGADGNQDANTLWTFRKTGRGIRVHSSPLLLGREFPSVPKRDQDRRGFFIYEGAPLGQFHTVHRYSHR